MPMTLLTHKEAEKDSSPRRSLQKDTYPQKTQVLRRKGPEFPHVHQTGPNQRKVPKIQDSTIGLLH